MTVGSWDRSVPDNGSTKLTLTKSWSGADRERVNYPPAPLQTVVRWSKRKKAYVTVQFRKKRAGVSRPPKRARDVDHPYVMEYHRLRDVMGTALYGYPYEGYTYDGYVMDTFGVQDWHGWSYPSEAFDSNDEITLIGKLREKLSGSDFNLGVALGEGHETLRMIGDTAISIAKSIHHLRKGDLAGAARSLLEPANRKPIKPYRSMKPFRPTVDTISSKWLELQYGWRPLLSDVESGAQFVAHKLSVPIRQTYRMSIRKEKVTTRVKGDPFLRGEDDIAVTGKAVAVARRAMKITVSEHPSAIQSLGLTNPEVIAWELVPFSFVADWFLPIGDYLNARATLSNVQISQTVTSTMITSNSYAPEGPAVGSDWSMARYTRVYLERSVQAGAPKLPLPRVKPLSEALSVSHALNGIALLAQAVVGRSKKSERDLALTNSLPPGNPRNGIIPSAR